MQSSIQQTQVRDLMVQPSVFDYLAKQTAQKTTVSNLHDAVKSTNIDKVNIQSWSDVITIARALQESRQYGNGLPIPETGTVVSAALADGANVTHTPSNSEIWMIQALSKDGCDVALKDSNGNIQPLDIKDSDTSTSTVPPIPIYLSDTMSLFISNSAGSEKTPSFAYFKVSL
jgi:hypothetical protein